MRKTQLVQGAERPWGKAARREAASLLATTDRRVSKLRPGCVSAMPQACRIGRGDRRTPTDWLRTRRRTRSVPCVQRRKRSTPTARRVPGGRRNNHSNRRTWTEDEGLLQLRRFGPCCLRRAKSNPQRQQFPRGRPFGRANHPSDQTRAQGSRPQVSMVGNLGESQTVRPLLPHRRPRRKVLQDPPRKVFTKVNS